MAFDSLRLQHFRSYGDYAVNLGQGVNIVVGPNGSGKTNLLEALYMLCVGGSFRVADRDTLQHGEQWFRLDGVWHGQKRTLTYKLLGDNIEKQFVIDGAKKARLTHQYKVPVVLFEPTDLLLLSGSPSGRRNYLDGLLAKLQPDFTWLHHQMERVLVQRNSMLKRRLSALQLEDQLFVWDIKFAELAAQVVSRRLWLIEQIDTKLSGLYSQIAHKTSAAEIAYVSSIPTGNYQAGLLQFLSANVSRDVERGFTGFGPQRDDFAITLNGSPATKSASRGEMRSLLLALKIIELQLLAEQSDYAPLLLLDDVFSELDNTRRQALAELAKSHQTLITTTDADNLVGKFFDHYKRIETK